MPYTNGNETKSIIAKGPESHKLHQEFEVNGDIYVGQPVKMHTADDTVTALLATDDIADMVGISMHPGKSAYGDFVTVATKGFAIIKCKCAEDSVAPGIVYLNGFDATADENLAGYPLIDNTDTAPIIGWALQGGDTDDIVEVLIAD